MQHSVSCGRLENEDNLLPSHSCAGPMVTFHFWHFRIFCHLLSNFRLFNVISPYWALVLAGFLAWKSYGQNQKRGHKHQSYLYEYRPLKWLQSFKFFLTLSEERVRKCLNTSFGVGRLEFFFQVDRWCKAYDAFKYEYQDMASIEKELGPGLQEEADRDVRGLLLHPEPHLRLGPAGEDVLPDACRPKSQHHREPLPH